MAGSLLTAGPAPAEVLLLKHGGMLVGEVEAVDDGFWVTQDGRALHVPKKQAAGRFLSQDAAYRSLAERIEQAGGSLPARLQLAEWCLTHRLHDAAREQLSAAWLATGDDPRIDRLAVRLENEAIAERTPPSPPKSSTPPTTTRRNPVQQAGYAAPVAPAAPLATLPPLDAEQRRAFTRRIQPLLVTNCTAGGCHQSAPAASPHRDPTQLGPTHRLVLDRRRLHGYADARSTEANLRAVLAWIDTESPADSPLLTAAAGPHAGVMPLAGVRRDEWLERLTEWVTAVAAHGSGPSPEPVPSPDRDVVDHQVKPASFEQQSPAGDRPATSVVTPRASEDRFTPRDEFDPEIFNRRTRAQQPSFDGE
ncbi:MAG: hypothetical protein AAFV43_15655 [Planctomycetota bacterium]